MTDELKEMSVQGTQSLSAEESAALGIAIKQVMGPVLEAMAGMMRTNAEALERLAAAQRVQNDRMEALEKQIRLNTPVTSQQVKYLNAAMKARSTELLGKYQIADAKAVKKMAGLIRRAVLVRYGIGKLNEIPRHEYPIATHMIETWMDMQAVRALVKEWRESADAAENCDAP